MIPKCNPSVVPHCSQNESPTPPAGPTRLHQTPRILALAHVCRPISSHNCLHPAFPPSFPFNTQLPPPLFFFPTGALLMSLAILLTSPFPDENTLPSLLVPCLTFTHPPPSYFVSCVSASKSAPQEAFSLCPPDLPMPSRAYVPSHGPMTPSFASLPALPKHYIHSSDHFPH